MTMPALDRIVASAVDRAFADLERYGSHRSPIDAMHDFLRRDSRFPKLGYLDCQLTFDFLWATKDDIADGLRERLADELADALRDERLLVLPRRSDAVSAPSKQQVQDAVTDALDGLFPDGKMTPAAEPLFWMALSLIAYEDGSKNAPRVIAWVKHQLGWDAPLSPPPDPPSPPPRATVVPFPKRPIKRRAKKGRE